MAGRDTVWSPRGVMDLTKTTLADLMWSFASRLPDEESRMATFAIVEDELALLATTDSGAKADLSKIRLVIKQAKCPHARREDYMNIGDKCLDCRAIVRKVAP